MGAAVEISTGSISPEFLAGKHVMLGETDLGVLDGTKREVRFEIPPGRHILFFKEGITTTDAVGFRVRPGHCAKVTVRDSDHENFFTPIFGGWYALERAGDQKLDEGVAGAEEIAQDEVPAEQ